MTPASYGNSDERVSKLRDTAVRADTDTDAYGNADTGR